MSKRVLVIFGTRPEAIKMCPVVKELRKDPFFEVAVCVTGQHREMLDQVLAAFSVTPEYDLSIMKEGQTLFDISTRILDSLPKVLTAFRPDLVFVHGDTSTSFCSALSCFYLHIPVAHVEAGLRTYDLQSPFPEEFNRQGVDIISHLLFAPTDDARDNLIHEAKDPANIFVTGNTAIDALQTTVAANYASPILDWAKGSRLIFLTAHRRENLGDPMRSIFRAINEITRRHSDIKIVYPLHPNPAVRSVAIDVLGDNPQVKLIEPLETIDCHNIMARSYLILSDSGGIQEEAPSLGKPVLVLRNTTERPEGIRAGTLKLVGTDYETILAETERLLSDEEEYKRMSNAINPYGDGHASERIALISKDFLSKRA